MILTSESHPIRTDFVELVPGIPGRLGMTFAPGKHYAGKSGSWRRELDTDLGRLVGVCGLRVLVSASPPAARSEGAALMAVSTPAGRR